MDGFTIFLIISLVIFGIVSYYYFIVKKVLQTDEAMELAREKLHKEEFESAEKRIEKEESEAKEKAVTILKESEMIAQELILELENALGEDTTKFESILPEGRDFEKELDVVREKIKEQYVKKIKQLLKNLEHKTQREAQKIEDLAEEQEENLDKNVGKMREEMLVKAREEIENFKREEEAEFEKRTKKIINAAAMETLGHALSSQEQEELIIRALDRARAALQGDAGGKDEEKI